MTEEKKLNAIKEDMQKDNSPFDADEVFNKKMECYPSNAADTLEETFKKRHSDLVYGKEPLSPYFDLFSEGYELAETDKEKQIEELKKENAKLRLKLEALEGQTPWKDIKDKSELIKENAELKSRDYWKGCLYASGKSELIHKYLQQKYNLTKAEKILAKLLEEENNNMYWEMDGSDKSSYYKIRKQAKQFLKDSEVKKRLKQF